MASKADPDTARKRPTSPTKRAAAAARPGAGPRGGIGGATGKARPMGPAESVAAGAEAAACESAPSNVIEAGIKAFSLARERAASGTGNVVASLMDPFGFRKLEEVFDQRVASALERLGMPSAQALAELTEQLKLLTARVERLESARRKK